MHKAQLSCHFMYSATHGYKMSVFIVSKEPSGKILTKEYGTLKISENVKETALQMAR